MKRTRDGAVSLYVGALCLVLAWIIVSTFDTAAFDANIVAWLMLSLLFGVTEYGQVYFHDHGARFGLTGSEAVLTVMIIGLSFPQVVIGVCLAIAAERILRRTRGTKLLFNVAQYGCASAAAAAVWAWFARPTDGLSLSNAGIAVASILIFAVLTHVLTSIVISMVEDRPLLALSRSVASATILSLAGSTVLGLLFAAAFVAAPWTLVLFPLPILGMYVGYTATLRTQRERDRVEHLYAATRALASSYDADHSITEFLKAVATIVSASDVRLILDRGGAKQWWGVDAGDVVAAKDPVEDDVHAQLLQLVSGRQETTVIGEAEELAGDLSRLMQALGVRTMLATPLVSDEVSIGCIVALGRMGAEDFDRADGRLLEALAHELMLSLDSYRLFMEVAEERERFARIFTGSKEGICLIDSAGRVKAWNPALERIAGYASDEVMDRVWSDVVLIRDRDENRVEGEELVGVEADEELELVTKSGPSRWVTTLSGPVGEAEGGGWVVLVRDVTAEHEVEQAKSDFLSTISHELRTPLTSIKGSLQVLGRGLDELPTDMAEQMITVTTRGADRLERLVMNLLAVSQLESGTMAVFPDEVSLGEVVRERVDALLSEHPSTRIELPDDPIVVRADRERLSHVLEHLLENARKFGGPEGTIVISAGVHSGYARLSVSDEGPGIPAADHDRIFDRFARLGNVLTRETQGAGVGLFIAKRSVESMGGTISVDSEPGRGATFTIMLPLAKPVVLTASGGSV